jgi:hypothetical protein
MATARIEGEHGDTAFAGAAQPTPDVLVEIKPPETTSIAAPTPASYRDFEALIDIAGRRASAAAVRSPHQWIADFVMPRISDPTLFQGSRSISILERLASDILPSLDESEELRSLAGAIINDEIERHRELLARLDSGIAQ